MRLNEQAKCLTVAVVSADGTRGHDFRHDAHDDPTMNSMSTMNALVEVGHRAHRTIVSIVNGPWHVSADAAADGLT
jgi:hypothetical protein